jgi:FxsC-like protein
MPEIITEETPWFFVSYARDDDRDKELKRFIKRLTEAVRRRVGKIPEDQVRFFDQQSIRPGDYWRFELVNAVSKSKTIVCFCSKAYFGSEYCGKELQAFRTREQLHSHMGPDKCEFIFPVLWHPFEHANEPEALSAVQDAWGKFPDPQTYKRKGLSYFEAMMALREKAKGFADELGELIYENAKKCALPQAVVTLQDLKELPNPFSPQSADVDVLCISNRPGEEAGHQWRPFRPTDESVAVLTRQAAAASGFVAHVRTSDVDPLSEIVKAQQSKRMVLLVIDARMLTDGPTMDYLKQCDAARPDNAVVLIVWNNEDAYIQANRPSLNDALEACFPSLCETKDPDRFRPALDSRTAFINSVRSTLIRTLKRMVANIDPPAGEVRAKPLVSATGELRK